MGERPCPVVLKKHPTRGEWFDLPVTSSASVEAEVVAEPGPGEPGVAGEPCSVEPCGANEVALLNPTVSANSASSNEV